MNDKNEGIEMSQTATETIDTPPTLTVIDPDQDDTAQVVVEEPTLTALEERQKLLAHHVRLVARGLSNALFVYGSQGGLVSPARCCGHSPMKAFPLSS